MAPNNRNNDKTVAKVTVAMISLLIVGNFEFIAWLFDPLGVHTALNDGKPMSTTNKMMTASINGGMLVLTAVSFMRKWSIGSAILTPFVITFTFAQWIFWWWPYLLGDLAGVHEMISEHKQQLAGLPRLLPAIGNHLVPDVEHTILLPISLANLCLVLQAYISLCRHEKDFFAPLALIIFSILFGSLQLLFAITSPTPFREIGPILVACSIYGLSYWLFLICKSAAKKCKSN